MKNTLATVKKLMYVLRSQYNIIIFINSMQIWSEESRHPITLYNLTLFDENTSEKTIVYKSACVAYLVCKLMDILDIVRNGGGYEEVKASALIEPDKVIEFKEVRKAHEHKKRQGNANSVN